MHFIAKQMFIYSCKKAMGIDQGVPSDTVPLRFKRKYSLLMGRKC